MQAIQSEGHSAFSLVRSLNQKDAISFQFVCRNWYEIPTAKVTVKVAQLCQRSEPLPNEASLAIAVISHLRVAE